MTAGLWVAGDDGEPQLLPYDEIDPELFPQLVKPLAGFMFPADAFRAMPLQRRPFIIEGWLPRQEASLIYSPTKAGKSYLCLQLARCVAHGEDFLGLKTQAGRVAYIQFELGEETLNSRMNETCQEYGENCWVGTTDLKLDTADGQKRLWAVMEAIEPDLLILDPLYLAIKGDEKEGKDMMTVLDFLRTVMLGFHCAVHLMHHAGKDLTKRGRGSSVIEDFAASYIRMVRTSKRGEPLQVEIMPDFLRHAPLPDQPIRLELAETPGKPGHHEFFMLGGNSVKDQVARYMAAAGDIVTPSELFKADIGSNTSVHKALKELEAEGKVKRADFGKYRWAT